MVPLISLVKVIEIKVIQSSLFLRQKKKLHKNQIKELDNRIRDIIKNPDIGEEKKVRTEKYVQMKVLKYNKIIPNF